MRIFMGQTDRWERRPLYSALLELFRSKGLAGATVIQGVAGFGPDSIVHELHLLRLSQDLPIVIEVVDSEQHIDSVLAEVDRMMSGGLITMEKVRVIYSAVASSLALSPSWARPVSGGLRAHSPRPSERSSLCWPMASTGLAALPGLETLSSLRASLGFRAKSGPY